MSEMKKTLIEMKKKTDSWENNQLVQNFPLIANANLNAHHQNITDFKTNAQKTLPKGFKNLARDKGKETNPARAFSGKNKRKRDRDVIEHPENI